MLDNAKIIRDAHINKVIPRSAEMSKPVIIRKFLSIKNKMIAEFLSHPVTREIEAGISSSNISKTLASGRGNLFSFIGFYEGDEPIEPILELLRATEIRFVKTTKRYIEHQVTLPSPAEIFAVTPMPWATGRSWARGIEVGISGYGYYLSKASRISRSGKGLQIENRIKGRSGKFKNTKYISALLNKYRKLFNQI